MKHKLLCVSGYAPGVNKDPEGYVRRCGIEFIKYLGYSSMGERHEFLVAEFPDVMPKYFQKIEYDTNSIRRQEV